MNAAVLMLLSLIVAMTCPSCGRASPPARAPEKAAYPDRPLGPVQAEPLPKDELAPGPPSIPVKALSDRFADLGLTWLTEFDGVVEKWRALPPASRHAEALRLARELEVGYANEKPRTFRLLVTELIAQGLDDVLDHLDRNLKEGDGRFPMSKKRMLHGLVSSVAGVSIVGGLDTIQPLLRVLAARNLTSIPLAPFRAGGIDFLLNLLEETEVSVDARVSCAYELGMWAGLDALPRMKRLRGDQTPYTSLGGIPFEQETLGHNVTAAIERIEARGR